MKTTKKILKINPNGELVQYNERLRIWESVSIAWSWSDVSQEYMEESKANYKRNKK